MSGSYKAEEDAAAARDVVAKILGHSLNFKKLRKIQGQRSKGADQEVLDAVKAANAYVLGILRESGLTNTLSDATDPTLCGESTTIHHLKNQAREGSWSKSSPIIVKRSKGSASCKYPLMRTRTYTSA